ncbi:secreted RxLR effector protein 161-like [Salvia miltiorrhiza]|uniref:secreted RxLR effector protein 161-like n=1 Tax=Salvia miltiorrhiza TaxID=226208 RepID=UPI0025AB9067|nr:secreted RxLR effector protein 161-like [Salvia miltiorrhiza]
MHESKAVCVPLAQHFRLTSEQKPKDENVRKEMANVPYANAVGSIMYIMICTRPDLSHGISVVSRYMADPGKYHWEALKWVLRYLKGAFDLGILFKRVGVDVNNPLKGYVDLDFAANLDSRRSQTGYVFTLYGAAVSWRPLLQPVVALSTTEVEYLAVKESLWLKGMLVELEIVQDAVEIRCDNQSALHLVKHQVFHERSKHIDIRHHFVRDVVERGDVKMVKVSTDDNATDMLTKALPNSKFKYCLELVNVLHFEV